jgi:hypothetical protein
MEAVTPGRDGEALPMEAVTPGRDGEAFPVAVSSRWGGLFHGRLWERWVSESGELTGLPSPTAAGSGREAGIARTRRATLNDVVRSLPEGVASTSRIARLRAQVGFYAMAGIAISGGNLICLFRPMGYEGATIGSTIAFKTLMFLTVTCVTTPYYSAFDSRLFRRVSVVWLGHRFPSGLSPSHST